MNTFYSMLLNRLKQGTLKIGRYCTFQKHFTYYLNTLYSNYVSTQSYIINLFYT